MEYKLRKSYKRLQFQRYEIVDKTLRFIYLNVIGVSAPRIEMKILAFFTLFNLIFLAGCWVSMPAVKPNSPAYSVLPGGECYSEETKYMKIGDSYQIPGYCIVATCGPKGIYHTGCPLAAIDDPHCTMTQGDVWLPHPKCCADAICTKKVEVEEEGKEKQVDDMELVPVLRQTKGQ